MLLTNASVATMVGGSDTPYGLIQNASVRVLDGNIVWLGNQAQLPRIDSDEEQVNLGGRLITPALIDCHTHIVHGGNRAREFEMRLAGASYEAIARAGGGIVSTVTDTRNQSAEELAQSALPRLDTLISEGVTTLEVKSGYGLDRDTELRMLRAARMLESLRNVRIKTTFLGAHAVPAEYEGRAEDYIDQVCLPTLQAATEENLVDAVDGFCEGIAFNANQIERVFQAARNFGLPVKLHAEQLSNSGGTQLAARYGAMSVDHIEYANEQDIKAIAKADCVAVLLPGAFYTLNETQMPPMSDLRQYKVPMALATDCNPGSSPLSSLLLTMNMACTLFKMTTEEALAGVTRNAARALRLDDCGTVQIGQRADLAIWDVEHPSELMYRIGFNPIYKRMFAGQW